MTTYQIQLTPRARASITQIVDQLEAEVSKTTAQHVRKGIMDTIRKLETFPEAHKVFEEISTK
jgi:plasmid stabilization system protein ParE